MAQTRARARANIRTQTHLSSFRVPHACTHTHIASFLAYSHTLARTHAHTHKLRNGRVQPSHCPLAIERIICFHVWRPHVHEREIALIVRLFVILVARVCVSHCVSVRVSAAAASAASAVAAEQIARPTEGSK